MKEQDEDEDVCVMCNVQYVMRGYSYSYAYRTVTA